MNDLNNTAGFGHARGLFSRATWPGAELIEWAAHTATALVEHVRINHGRRNIAIRGVLRPFFELARSWRHTAYAREE